MHHDELLATELGDIVIRLANFQANMATNGPFKVTHAVPILQQLDSDLKDWALALPFSWRYVVHSCNPQENFFTNQYHSYPGFSVAATWNQYRVARCLVSDLMLEHLGSVLASIPSSHLVELPEQPDRVMKRIQNTCADICASLPYFLSQMTPNDLPKPGEGALEVMWALYICGSNKHVSHELRLWAVKQLEKIGREMGVLQALGWADSARSKLSATK